jgi:hypothetical protein
MKILFVHLAPAKTETQKRRIRDYTNMIEEVSTPENLLCSEYFSFYRHSKSGLLHPGQTCSFAIEIRLKIT